MSMNARTRVRPLPEVPLPVGQPVDEVQTGIAPLCLGSQGDHPIQRAILLSHTRCPARLAEVSRVTSPNSTRKRRPLPLNSWSTHEHRGFPARVCAEGAACVDETVAGKASGCSRPSALPQGATVKVVDEDERGDAATPGLKSNAVAASGFDLCRGNPLLFPELPRCVLDERDPDGSAAVQKT